MDGEDMEEKKKKENKKQLNNLELLKLADKQDSEAFERMDFEIKKDFKREYEDFYNDIKQKSKFVREDW